MILMGPFQLEILYDLMTVIGPLLISRHTLLLYSHQYCQLSICKDGRKLCADRDQKCLSNGCSLLPRMPLPGTQGVFCWNRGKNQNTATKGLLQASAEHHQPGAFGVCCWSSVPCIIPVIPWHFVPPAPLSALAVPMLTAAHPKLLPLLAPGGCYHV